MNFCHFGQKGRLLVRVWLEIEEIRYLHYFFHKIIKQILVACKLTGPLGNWNQTKTFLLCPKGRLLPRTSRLRISSKFCWWLNVT